MRKVVTVVIVGLLVVSAGCGTSDPAPDREPYDVDEEFGPRLLPGLTEAGVTDENALANEHYSVLEDEPSHRDHRTTYRNESGALVSARETTQTITDDAMTARIEYVPESADPGSETRVTHAWIDGDTEYTRQVTESGAVTYLPNANRGWTEPSLPVSLIELYGATDTVSVERHHETERYRLEGTGDIQPVENASFEIVLSADGYVETYRVEGTQPLDGEQGAVEYVGGFERIDDPDLEEPEWLDEARAVTG